MLFFQKGSFCTDLFPNTLYRKCIKFAPKRVGGASDSLDPPFPTPLGRHDVVKYVDHSSFIISLHMY